MANLIDRLFLALLSAVVVFLGWMWLVDRFACSGGC